MYAILSQRAIVPKKFVGVLFQLTFNHFLLRRPLHLAVKFSLFQSYHRYLSSFAVHTCQLLSALFVSPFRFEAPYTIVKKKTTRTIVPSDRSLYLSMATTSAEEAMLGLKVSEGGTQEANDKQSATNVGEEGVKQRERKEKKEKKKKEKEKKMKNKPQQKVKQQLGNRDGMEILKGENFGDWYSQLVVKAEMIEFYDISGCYIFRPWSFAMWDMIRDFFDAEIKKLGVQNAYFPLFVSKKRLTAEEDHIEGFAAEVAWVTKSGSGDLEEPIAVRPTSETIMYPAYAKWIRSHRDLPLKLNQWSNVVRWEFKYPTPFIRSREFLWQEGHTAFAAKEEADEEVLTILELYRRVYEELLAVPVIKGRKSEEEKFAGGLYTTTVEGFIPANGRAIQGATSHCLGQNFSKMFGIGFEAENGKQLVWQNSWGITTRTIGVMAMVHGDDSGLVLPPRIAPVQVIIVPIVRKGVEQVVTQGALDLEAELKNAGIRVSADIRDDKNPGWKFNHWELKGVPLRVEVGPRDLEAGTVVAVRRVDKVKVVLQREGIVNVVKDQLDDIQKSTLDKARKERDEHIVQVNEWANFVPVLDKRNMALAAWCEVAECEKDVKERSGKESAQRAANEGEGEEGEEVDARALSGKAKTLCIPFREELVRLGVPTLKDGTTCFACHRVAKSWTLWGRSY